MIGFLAYKRIKLLLKFFLGTNVINLSIGGSQHLPQAAPRPPTLAPAGSVGHLCSLLWGHLRQPGLSFPALSLRCGSLPARVIAETATQEMDDSTAQFPKKHTTYFLHSFFFSFKWAQVWEHVGSLV